MIIAAITDEAQASFKVGQTAFVIGSHILNTSAKIMVHEGGQEILDSHLIRPHLRSGDALIFDCRILHFGLANQSKVSNNVNYGTALRTSTSTSSNNNDADISGESTWRTMLYINHHQQWFSDPKNWNEKEKLFPCNEQQLK